MLPPEEDPELREDHENDMVTAEDDDADWNELDYCERDKILKKLRKKKNVKLKSVQESIY